MNAPPGPVFVVGSMRSGSTLLRLILDSHPHIAIGAETGFMGGLRAAKDIPRWKFGKGWYERLGWTEAEFDARLREFYAGLFQRFAAEQGKPRWGEKTPFHTEYIAEMSRIFPDAVFVGLVRHPGAVASSLRATFHYGFGEALAYWSDTNLRLVRSGSELADRFVLLRYEDLVLEGEPVLRDLLAWLGEPWHPDVLEHHRVQREKGAPRAAEGRTITRDPVDADRAVQWVRELTEPDRHALDGVTALAGFLGYQPRDPDLRERPSEGVRWLVDGVELARRRLRWQDRLSFDARPATALPEGDAEELAARVAHLEGVLARVRSRRAVRVADAMRTVQHGRSLDDVRRAWTLLRSPRYDGRA